MMFLGPNSVEVQNVYCGSYNELKTTNVSKCMWASTTFNTGISTVGTSLTNVPFPHNVYRLEVKEFIRWQHFNQTIYNYYSSYSTIVFSDGLNEWMENVSLAHLDHLPPTELLFRDRTHVHCTVQLTPVQYFSQSPPLW